MKKFILTANLVALLALVPAVIIGYLHKEPSKDGNKDRIELVKDAGAHRDGVSILQLVRTS